MNNRPHTRTANQSGFTLMEFMTTLAVAGVLAAIATPNMREFIRNSRLTSAANDMLHSMQVARAEAMKRRQNVVVCMSPDSSAANPACTAGGATGWIVFEDTNNSWSRNAGEQIIERQTFSDTVHLVADQDYIVSFASSGFIAPAGAATPTTAVVMCDERGNVTVGNQSAARGVLISNLGRARVTRATSEISDMLADRIGGGCP